MSADASDRGAAAADPPPSAPRTPGPVFGNLAGVLLVSSGTPLDPDDLTDGEATAFAALPREPRRRMTWLTARRAFRRALSCCGLPADTSQYRFPGPAASLSHSGDLAVAAVAVAVARPDTVVGLGVDVELDRTPHPRTAPFFLTEAERLWLATVPAAERSPALLRLWTVKEALFKADPANAGAVLLDYTVASPSRYRGRAARTDPAGPAVPEFRYASFATPRGFVSIALALSRFWRVNPMVIVDFDQVAQQISSLLSIPVERLTPDTTVAELAPDSFMFVEVAVSLQEEYDVVFSQEDLESLRTLGDLTALLQSRRAAASDT